MKINFYQKTILIISFIGALFSEYLNVTKFSALNCVMDNNCLYFIGYPVYWYNLALFILIFLIISLSVFEIFTVKGMATIEIFLSILGIFFTGYMGLSETLGVTDNMNTLLGMPLFVYSFVLYLFIFAFSVYHVNLKKEHSFR